ncbi:uncharacterized protein LOC135345292 isoform X2 [Halichondria panicea]|uniref:uncharacterized protein LOC135345292 isoform X2 n=1 Tax=Halichondria panicea TaxID=6063 RepID=UPI00312B98BC
MDFLKPQQKQTSNLKTSISVESLQRPNVTHAEGDSTTKLTTSRYMLTGAEQVSGSSTHLSKGSLSLATNLHHIGKELFFPVTGLTVESFLSETPPLSPRQQPSPSKAPPTDDSPPPHGRKVCVNGREIAVFLYGNNFYAVDEHCSHLGGPLHLGDIEDSLSLTILDNQHPVLSVPGTSGALI